MSETSLSERILADNAEVFARMVGHRFVQDVAADRLPPAVFDRYLVIEGAFVETAIAIFALATAKATGIGTQRHLIGVLDALANTQVGYFEQVLSARRLSPLGRAPPPAAVAAFRDRMRGIAETGGYAEIVTAMFAAEWMYWTWCRDASACNIADPHLHAWVALHAAPEFEHQALWLKTEVDRVGAPAAEAERTRLSRLFGEVQRLEIAFHDAAYDGP